MIVEYTAAELEEGRVGWLRMIGGGGTMTGGTMTDGGGAPSRGLWPKLAIESATSDRFSDERSSATDCREQTGAIAARSSRASSGRRSLLERPEVSKEYLSWLKRRCRRVKISENSRCGGIVRNVQCNMFNTNMFNAMQASVSLQQWPF